MAELPALLLEKNMFVFCERLYVSGISFTNILVQELVGKVWKCDSISFLFETKSRNLAGTEAGGPLDSRGSTVW